MTGTTGPGEEVQRQVRHKQDELLLGSALLFFQSASNSVTNVCHVPFPYSFSPWGQSCIPGSRVCFEWLSNVLKLFDFIHVNFSFSVTVSLRRNLSLWLPWKALHIS